MEQDRLREHVDTIREVFSYIKQFSGTTFVVKIDDVVMGDPLSPCSARTLRFSTRPASGS